MATKEDVRSAYYEKLKDTSLSQQEFAAYVERVKALESETPAPETKKQ